MLVARFKEVGGDTSTLGMDMIPELLMIAKNQLLPEVMLRFLDNRNTLVAVARLPLSGQSDVLEKGEIVVAVPSKNGKFEEKKVSIDKAKKKEVDQAFKGGRVRTFSEQAAAITARAAMQPKPATSDADGFLINYERGEVTVTRGQIFAIDKLRELLMELEGQESSVGVGENLSKSISVPCTPSEHHNIEVLAAANKTTMGHTVRRFAVRGGAFRKIGISA